MANAQAIPALVKNPARKSLLWPRRAPVQPEETPGKIKVFELPGTSTFLGRGPGTSAQLTDPGNFWKVNLNSNFVHEGVDYSAETFPMGPSVATGKTNLVAAINGWRGQFVLIGTSQGAAVVSDVYDEIRSGSLTARNADLVAGVTFGNPRREAGHTWPGGTDPGGHGLLTTRLSGTEQRWWDFVVPDDPAAATTDDAVGVWQRVLFGSVWTDWDGTSPALASIATALRTDLFNFGAAARAISNIYFGVFAPGAPHRAYGTYTPIQDDPRTSMQIAADYINSIAP